MWMHPHYGGKSLKNLVALRLFSNCYALNSPVHSRSKRASAVVFYLASHWRSWWPQGSS